jgi:hypothetical protein
VTERKQFAEPLIEDGAKIIGGKRPLSGKPLSSFWGFTQRITSSCRLEPEEFARKLPILFPWQVTVNSAAFRPETGHSMTNSTKPRPADLRSIAAATQEPERDRKMLTLAEQLDDQDRGRATANARDQITRWRTRAQEMRNVAEQFDVPSAQDGLRRAAANCEKMADHAEALLAGPPPAESQGAG